MPSVLASLLGNLLVIGVLGLLAGVLTSVTLQVFHIRWAVLTRGVAAYLATVRQKAYTKRGLYPRPVRLHRQTLREARAFLQRSPGLTSPGLTRFVRSFWEPFASRSQLREAVGHAWPDLAADVDQLVLGLSRLELVLEKRLLLTMRLVATVWAVAITLLFYRFGGELWPQLGGSGGEVPFAGLFLVGTLVTLGASLMNPVTLSLVASSAATDAPSEAIAADPEIATKEPAGPPIGRDGCAVRILTFASGGFDTIMQLGVAHALTVIQGRAPDAVIGVSGGALNAAAVADVLQAGDEEEARTIRDAGVSDDDPARQWSELSVDVRTQVQEGRLTARAARLRFYMEQALRVPFELGEALLPDAYQIDSHDPLQPLEQPRFAAQEREERIDAAIARSGLVRLYNHLLGLDLSIGTLTRFVRRGLGILASLEIPNRSTRVFLIATEVLRFWIVLGVNLPRVAPLLPMLLRPILRKPRPAVTRTTGGLIFRFPQLGTVKRVIGHTLSFCVLLVMWLGVSLLPFTFGFLTRLGVGAVNENEASAFVIGLAVTGLVYLTALVLWRVFQKQVTEFDRITLKRARSEAMKGVTVYIVFTAMWTAILLAPFAASAWAWQLFGGPYDVVDVVFASLRVLLLLGLALVVLSLLLITLRSSDEPYVDKLLRAYHLERSLFQTHGLKLHLVRMFDRHFYGRPNMDRVVDESLKNELHGTIRTAEPRTVGSYHARRREPIHVGLAVADASTGEMLVVPPNTALVDGLLAAISVTPLFAPQELDGRLCIDAANIANEPTRAVFGLLRRHGMNPASPVVHVYAVSAFPVSRRQLGGDPRGEHQSLVDVAQRALRLQRFRDATLERRLTELVTRSIPPDHSQVSVTAPWTGQNQSKTYFRAWVTPVELDRAPGLSPSLYGLSAAERTSALKAAIADGCRAALQVMIPRTIGQPGKSATRQCSKAVEAYLKNSSGALADLTLPGKHSDGPGLDDVCSHCCLGRGSESEQPRTLRLADWQEVGPAWPHERAYTPEGEKLADDPHYVERSAVKHQESLAALKALKSSDETWPRHRTGGALEEDEVTLAGANKPTVSLLFSGGVFRGVYQVGVINALNEIGLRPDLVAGASVGSITGAMLVRTYVGEPEPGERQHRIARMAAAYLAMDRLILTDRFADFVRDVTLRAAETRFSIRQADRFFRKFDHPRFRQFDRNARQVLAGIERLFYVNPFQVSRFVKALRNGQSQVVIEELHAYVEQWLSRLQVDDELLGAEPLSHLIDAYVTSDDGSLETFDDIRRASGIQLLTTATNLTAGRLEVFGDQPLLSSTGPTSVKEALLASSAFPGVFRPRWAWEVHPTVWDESKYIDGGVMDNLPLDAVAEFLARAAKVGLLNPTPPTPHLVLAVSLEVNVRPDAAAERLALRRSWPNLWSRASELRYNTKLDSYAKAEKILLSLSKRFRDTPDRQAIDLVDLHVVSVKPEWLCQTFAFHPMLGFRRAQQARSIAHGCASTLLRFANVEPTLLKGWGVNVERVPRQEVTDWAAAFEHHQQAETKPDDCWLRPGCRCPFSAVALRDLAEASPRLSLPTDTVAELAAIHEHCATRAAQLQRV